MNTTTTTVKFSDVRGNLYAALTTGLTHDQNATESVRRWARDDYATVAPHVATLVAARRHEYARQIMETYPSVSVNLAGDVIGIPDDATTIKVVTQYLDSLLRDLDAKMGAEIRRIIDEAKVS